MAGQNKLEEIYRRLLATYGPQHWWPADSPFEVMVGAILTQNTAWKNVEQAIQNLRQAGCLSAGAILQLEPPDLAQLLKPSGYFNIKARRLRNFCQFLQQEGSEQPLHSMPTTELRKKLLSVNGIGPETADDMLLYAFERPVFVVDAYTRRLLRRHGLAGGDETYESLRRLFERVLNPDVSMFNEYHALIVRHAKTSCSKKPKCAGCCLAVGCARIGCQG